MVTKIHSILQGSRCISKEKNVRESANGNNIKKMLNTHSTSQREIIRLLQRQISPAATCLVTMSNSRRDYIKNNCIQLNYICGRKIADVTLSHTDGN